MWLCILYTGRCKQQPKMGVSCFTSAAEKEKCWGFEVSQFFITRLSVHSLGLLCWLSGEWKQKQSYKGIMFIETLKKESGEWLFLPCEKKFNGLSLFTCENPQSLSVASYPWDHKISNQSSSLGPGVLILLFFSFCSQYRAHPQIA